jgi:hypothetical protein
LFFLDDVELETEFATALEAVIVEEAVILVNVEIKF